MNSLTAGMFRPGNALLYRLSAFSKLLGLLLLTASAILTDSVPGWIVLVGITAALITASGLRLREALASVGRLVWFFLLILLMNLCFGYPEQAWVKVWIFTPSLSGLLQGLRVVARVILVLIWSNLLTCTTAPLALTEAIEQLLSPLRLIRLPVGLVAMILSVAIQFIPTLFGETEIIRRAQTARGARFDSRRLKDRALAVLPLVVPIFLAAFKRADELSLAMEARGYRGQDGKGKKPELHRPDALALLACAALTVASIWLM